MRLSEALTQPFQAPASIRKFSSSQVYLFRSRPSDSDDSSSEEELDVMELRARGKEQQRRNAAAEKVGDVILLERQVSKDDNLNKLALQYGCKVADIKRVNNFIQEQDLYALKSIRIPVKVNGILTETQDELLSAQRVGLLLPAELSGSKEEEGSSKDTEQIDQYFRGIDQDIEKAALLDVPPTRDTCIETPNWSSSVRKEVGAGADCGIQWWNAVFIMLLVGIILPVFYIVYFKTQQLEMTTTTNTTLPANNTDCSVRGTPVLRVFKEHLPTIQTHKEDFLPSGG